MLPLYWQIKQKHPILISFFVCECNEMCNTNYLNEADLLPLTVLEVHISRLCEPHWFSHLVESEDRIGSECVEKQHKQARKQREPDSNLHIQPFCENFHRHILSDLRLSYYMHLLNTIIGLLLLLLSPLICAYNLCCLNILHELRSQSSFKPLHISTLMNFHFC